MNFIRLLCSNNLLTCTSIHDLKMCMVLQVLKFVAVRLQNEQQPVIAPAVHELRKLPARMLSSQHLPWLGKIHDDSKAQESVPGLGLMDALAPAMLLRQLDCLQLGEWEQDEMIAWILSHAKK